MSEFVINPKLKTTPQPTGFNKVFSTVENDVIEIVDSNNFVFASNGNDVINLTNSGGNNRVYSGAGSDLINLRSDDLNIIADLEIGQDRLVMSDLTLENLIITSRMGGIVIGLGDRILAILVGIDARDLTEDSFVFT